MRATSRLVRFVLVCLCLALPAGARAERLPIRAYTTADGLAHNDINRIVRDSRGFLWFATGDGLSRFDGYGFTNYTVEHGLPHRTVTDLLETRSGELWVSTLDGIARFSPEGRPERRIVYVNDVADGPPMFSVIVPEDEHARARAITVLLETRDGTIWCGTRKGLFRLERRGGRYELRAVEIGIPPEYRESGYVSDLFEDRFGSLWITTSMGLYRRWTDGTVARYTVHDGLPGDFLQDLYQDRQGRLWVASRTGGFFRLAVDASRRPPVVVERYGYDNALPTPWVFCLWETQDGRFWVATNQGLIEFVPGSGGGEGRFRGYARRNGLTHHAPTVFAEDASGNLWMGTDATGAMKLARSGFVTYAEQDGLIAAFDVFDDMAGDVYVRALVKRGASAEVEALNATVARTGGEDFVHRWGHPTAHGFEFFRPPPPFGFGWVGDRVTLQTRDGGWWIAGDIGIYRFPASRSLARIATARAERIYTTDNGLAAPQAYALFEDSRGDIWVSSLGAWYGLARWDPRTQTLRNIADSPGLPSPRDELARAFGEDASGSVWVGFNTGIARYRNGAFRFFSVKEGLPLGGIRDIYADRAGRLWLASTHGLIRVENCAGEQPSFMAYTTAQGLSGNSIDAITEDLYGRIYAATGRGIDQLDPDTGRVRHFTADDGLARGRSSPHFAIERGLSGSQPTKGCHGSRLRRRRRPRHQPS